MSDNINKIVVAFPCAGGAANNYQKYAKYVKKTIFQFEYSGHWTRYEEPLYLDANNLLADVDKYMDNVCQKDSELILFGHSMGALVALLTAWNLQEKKGIHVGTLILSSCLPPDRLINNERLAFKNDEEIIDFLKSIRQMPQKILDSLLFQEDLLPFIRNDFRIFNELKKIAYNQNICLNTKLVILHGTKDSLFTRYDKNDWVKYNNNIENHEFEGDHFYLYDKVNIQYITEIINKI